MRTFSQLLTEREFESFRGSGDVYVEVFIDPTLAEIKDAAHGALNIHPPEHPDGPTVWGRAAYLVRAFIGHKNLYIWNHDTATHEQVRRRLSALPALPESATQLIPSYLYYYPASGTARFTVSAFGFSSPDATSAPADPVEVKRLLRRLPSINTFRTVLVADEDDWN